MVYKPNKNLTPSMEVTKISQEAIEKAFKILAISKASHDDADENDVKKKQDEDDIKKAADAEKFKSEYADIVKKAEDMKKQAAELNIDLDSSKMGDPQGGAITASTTPIVKAESAVEIKTSEGDTIIKSLADKIDALGLLVVSKSQENEELKKGLESASEFQARLAERLGMIEKQPFERKSIATAKYLERDFEKGGDVNRKGEKILSLSNQGQKSELIELLWKASGATEGGIKDAEFAKASSYLETTGSLGSDRPEALRIANRLKNEQQIIVIS